MPFLEDSDGLARSDLSLHPVGVDTWGGFVFVQLTPAEAEARGLTLAAQLGGVPDRLRRYPLAELRVARRLAPGPSPPAAPPTGCPSRGWTRTSGSATRASSSTPTSC
jgi:hypothetical protein